MAERLRIGIIGAGSNTRDRHIPGFQAIEGVEVSVVCNRSEASGRRVAEEFGIPRVETDWRNVASGQDVDAVCIGTWPCLHAEATCLALERGKHVLTEARMASNVREAEAMAEKARSHPDLVAQIVPSPFTLDFDAAVTDRLGEGQLGDLREVCVTHTLPTYVRADTPLGWRQRSDRSGHNVLTLGIYHEIILRWLGQNPEWVVADGEIFHPRRIDPETGRPGMVDLPESLTVLGRGAGGMRMVYHHSGLESGRGRNEMRLNGSAGSLRLDLAEGRLYRSGAGEPEEAEVFIPEKERRGWQVEADFVRSIRHGEPVRLTDFGTGLRYMEFTEAVTQSYRNGGEKTPVGSPGKLSY